MKLIGKLTHWSNVKRYGFIEVKTPEPIGTKIDRYFLHEDQISLRPEVLHTDQIVCFEVRDWRPKPGKLPYAGMAEVFETLEQLQAAEKGGEGSVL